ncbi:MAG: ArsR family transcriptional regulator [Dehalococcoidia bacterium]
MKDPIADPLTPARKEVILAIKLIGEPTVDQLGEHLGLSVSTLRAHLLSLEAARLIGHHTEGQGPGRRRHRYFLTQGGEDLFPSENNGLVSVLTQMLLRSAPHELEGFFELAGARRAADIRAMSAGQPARVALTNLGVAFDSSGYMARTEGDEGAGRMELHHCPFLGLAREWPGFCELELEKLADSIPGSAVARERYRLAGDRICVYRFDYAAAEGHQDVTEP